jgi:excisionase family DNA binding protein
MQQSDVDHFEHSEATREWLTIVQAAHYINMSTGFLRKWVRNGTIPFVRVGAKALRFRRRDLDRWLETQSQSENPLTRSLQKSR